MTSGDRRRIGAALISAVLLATALATFAEPRAAGIPFGEAVEELRGLREKGALEEADAAGRTLLDRAAAQFGERSAEVMNVLGEMVLTRLAAVRLTDDTLALSARYVLLRSDLLGEHHPSLTGPLLDLAYLLHVHADLDSARETYRWAMEICDEQSGDQADLTARALAGLGNVEADLGHAAEGERLMRRAVSILESKYGTHHPQTADALFRLASFLFDHERYEEAKDIWIRNLETFRMPEHHSDRQVARCLHNLGELHHKLGEIPQALDYLQRALAMRKREDSPNQKPWPQAVSTARALAEVLRDSGDLSGAKAYYEEALRGYRDWLGKPDPYRYAAIESAFGLLLEESGDWEAARHMQEAALALRLEKLPEYDMLVGRSRARLGALLLRMGFVDEAETELRQALEIQEEALGSQHSDVASTMTSLARIEELHGRYAEARQLLEAAARILSGISLDHPELIDVLTDLASLEEQHGDPRLARQRVESGLAIVARLFGPESPRSGDLMYEKARLLARTSDLEAALRTALVAEGLRLEHVRATIHSFPERQALAFVESRTKTLDLALSLLRTLDEKGRKAWTREVWDAVIRSRALVLDAVMSRYHVARAQRDSELRDLAADLARARERFAVLSLRGGGDVLPARQAELVRQAARHLEGAELAFAEASGPFLRELRARAIGFDDAVRPLDGGSSLIGIVKFEEQPFSSPAAAGRETYLAFVYGGVDRKARFVSLGPADAIDRLVRRWRALGEQVLDGSQRAESESLSVGRRLRSLVWDPIRRLLADVEQVFLVPDGDLSLINFAALPVGNERYLVEEGPRFHLLTTERDLAELQDEPKPGRGLLALGGADFDGTPRNQVAAMDEESEAALTRGWDKCQRFASHWFEPLGATSGEVDAIAETWKSVAVEAEDGRLQPADLPRVLKGVDANEVNFKRLAPGRRVLHLATHGFFLDAACSSRLVTAASSAAPTPGARAAAATASLTGLALAGANHRDSAPAGSGDNMLTASEISSVDLTGVEWAVLSACNTGVGEVLSGEGTFGLRRAFAVAGARTVITSLWSVDDVSTRELMSRLYELRFRDGLETAEALRQASLALLRERRLSSRSTHPVYWGAFVASGDWR